MTGPAIYLFDCCCCGQPFEPEHDLLFCRQCRAQFGKADDHGPSGPLSHTAWSKAMEAETKADRDAKKALATIDRMADRWAEEVDLQAMCRETYRHGTQETIESLARLCFSEGAYRGRLSLIEHPRTTGPDAA